MLNPIVRGLQWRLRYRRVQAELLLDPPGEIPWGLIKRLLRFHQLNLRNMPRDGTEISIVEGRHRGGFTNVEGPSADDQMPTEGARREIARFLTRYGYHPPHGAVALPYALR